MNPVKKTLTATTNFVRTHKTPITIIATAAVTAVAMRKLKDGALKEAYAFIEDAGLTEKFIESTNPFDI